MLTKDLDPYSPASNLNTEEMEELLRVEEEILNSPEKPMGYPKALFSTKELSKPYFTGCTFRPGWLLISCANKDTADWLKATVPELKLWTGANVELEAEANMPKPQVYIGYFPKTEKYSNEDILQLLEGQNRALRIGDWRILNRVDRGKQIELPFSVDPLLDEQLKSRRGEERPRCGHACVWQGSPLELPTCSNSLTPTTRSSEEQSSEAAGSNMAAPTSNAATTERPTSSAPQVARLRPPLYGRLQHKQSKGARRSAEETALLGGNRGKKRAALGRRRD
ncbi:hypothetical protein ACLKA7_002627 [Drosophila subpalustris]